MPSTASTRRLMTSLDAPITSSERATFSNTVRRGMSLKSWKTMPMLRRSRGRSRRLSPPTSMPATSILPVVGRMAPYSSLSIVVLPAPEGPVT